MKKVIVAGAGHGGIVAAKNLAENGCDVTVYEKLPENEIGYDWYDCLWYKVFDEVGFSTPDDKYFTPFMDMRYISPSQRVEMYSPKSNNSSSKYIDRKVLLNHLVAEARAAGVKFEFGTEVINAVTVGFTVRGVHIVKNGEPVKITADLVIDACGADSPLRKSLPLEFGFMNEIPETDKFNVYRAYFEKNSPFTENPVYKIYFFHCGTPGMDWVIEEGDHYDVLVGAFGAFEEDTVEKAVADFRRIYPDMSEKILRGGQCATIPLRKALPLLVCGGYALVGDSASMTEPLSGSGITKSMQAGKILADTVIAAGDKKLTVDVLWQYQYTYFKKVGFSVLRDAVIKECLADIDADAIDFLCDNEIMTTKEVSGRLDYEPADIFKKLSLIKNPALVKLFSGALVKILKFGSVKEGIPESYDAEAVNKWIAQYEAL